MQRLPAKIKPIKGFSHLAHIGLVALLPVLAYILVRTNFVAPAILLAILSKWRMFAVRPRYWMANIIANGVDITVAVALILFMASTASTWWQLFWTGLWALWLIWLKPRYDVLSVSAQAMIGQLLGLAVLYLKFGDASLLVLVGTTWVIAYSAARHFLTSFEEAYAPLLAHIWGYFAAGLAFILGHWLLFYGSIAQIIVIMTVIGYGVAAMYYLDATDRLTPVLERQLTSLMCGILLLVLVLSDWSGATI